MATKKIAGAIAGITARTAANGNKIVVLRMKNGSQAVFNRSYLDAIAEGLDSSVAELSKYHSLYNAGYEVEHLLVGDMVDDRANKGQKIEIKIEHDRFSNLVLELKEEMLQTSLIADKIGSAFAKQFTTVKAPAKQVARVADPADAELVEDELPAAEPENKL